MKLKYPITSLEKKVLFSAGETFSRKALSELIASNKRRKPKFYTLLDHKTVKKDLLSFLQPEPYSIIFDDDKNINRLMRLMGKVSLLPQALKILDFYRKADVYTYRHFLIVFALSTRMAMDIVEKYKDRITEAASGPTHDIGKFNIPMRILTKAGPLTRSELDQLKHHSIAGYVLLSYYSGNIHHPAAQVARDHHERIDGSGYPRGVQLDNLLVEIVAVCDIFDALISARPYRPSSYDLRTACDEITAMAERGEISWNVVKNLIALNRHRKIHFSECDVSGDKRGVPPSQNNYGKISKAK